MFKAHTIGLTIKATYKDSISGAGVVLSSRRVGQLQQKTMEFGYCGKTLHQSEIAALTEGLNALKVPCNIVVATASKYLQDVVAACAIITDGPIMGKNKKALANQAELKALAKAMEDKALTIKFVTPEEANAELIGMAEAAAAKAYSMKASSPAKAVCK